MFLWRAAGPLAGETHSKPPSQACRTRPRLSSRKRPPPLVGCGPLRWQDSAETESSNPGAVHASPSASFVVRCAPYMYSIPMANCGTGHQMTLA